MGGSLGAGLAGMTVTAVFLANGCLDFSWTSYTHHQCPSDRTAVGITLGGGVAGAIIGAFVRGEHWVRAPLSRVHASLAPTGVRLAIGSLAREAFPPVLYHRILARTFQAPSMHDAHEFPQSLTIVLAVAAVAWGRAADGSANLKDPE